MSSRQEEKERRRREREEAEQATKAAAASRKRMQLVMGLILALVLVGGGATFAVLSLTGGDDTETEAPAGSANIPAKQQGDLKKAAAAAGCKLVDAPN
jgi:hypothetical protein